MFIMQHSLLINYQFLVISQCLLFIIYQLLIISQCLLFIINITWPQTLMMSKYTSAAVGSTSKSSSPVGSLLV